MGAMVLENRLPLEQANEALLSLKQAKIPAAAVILKQSQKKSSGREGIMQKRILPEEKMIIDIWLKHPINNIKIL